MSQAHVEHIIGRLVADDDWRSRDRTAAEEFLDGLAQAEGLAATVNPRSQRAGGAPMTARLALAALLVCASTAAAQPRPLTLAEATARALAHLPDVALQRDAIELARHG